MVTYFDGGFVMESFEYFEPKTVEEACTLLAKYANAKVLAGGASLVVLLRNKLIFPDQIVNLKSIAGIDRIELSPEGELRIGALCRDRDIESSPVIQERFGVLAEAASSISSPPIRNMGTIGGNICHADPSADFPPALIALGARLSLAGSSGPRTIPIHQFFTDYYETVLKSDEILTEILIPSLPSSSGGVYLKLAKTTNSVAIVGVGAVVGLDEQETCVYAGLGVGGAASTPLAIGEVANLVGKPVDDASIRAVAEAAMKQSQPISTVHASEQYRREMVGVLVTRALMQALKKAREKVKSPRPTE
jgi:carbon-monoxide dehydrogenase medium subunit